MTFELTFSQLVAAVLILFHVKLALLRITEYLFPRVFSTAKSNAEKSTEFQEVCSGKTSSAVVILLWGSFIEELTFRVFPILLAFTVPIMLSHGILKVIIFLFISSIIFGKVHGGWQNLMLQGIGGLVYSFVFVSFLLYNGLMAEAFVICWATHYLWNIRLLFEEKFCDC